MKKRKYLIFIAVLAGGLLIWGISGLFKVSKVEVEVKSAACVTEEAVKTETGLFGSNIFFIGEDSIKKKLTDKFVCIKDVKVRRNLPQAVNLAVDGRVAIASVMTYSGFRKPIEATPSSQSALLNWSVPSPASQQFLADEGGVLFAQFQNEELPKLFLPEQTVKTGQRLDEGLFKKISTIFSEVKKSEINIAQAVVSDQDLLVLEHQKVAFSLKKDISKQLVSLQLILQKAKIDESMIDTIDLRFDKPVVRFAPKK